MPRAQKATNKKTASKAASSKSAASKSASSSNRPRRRKSCCLFRRLPLNRLLNPPRRTRHSVMNSANFLLTSRLSAAVSTLRLSSARSRNARNELKAPQKLNSKRKRAKGNRQPSGFVKPTLISDELATFLAKIRIGNGAH